MEKLIAGDSVFTEKYYHHFHAPFIFSRVEEVMDGKAYLRNWKVLKNEYNDWFEEFGEPKVWHKLTKDAIAKYEEWVRKMKCAIWIHDREKNL